MLNLTNNSKYKLFTISWVLLMLGIICDISLFEKIHILFFKVNLQTSSIVLILYLLAFFAIIPLGEFISTVADKANFKYLFLTFILLVIAFVSSYYSDMRSFALSTTFFRYTLFLLCFICTVTYCRHFENAARFIFRTFIYFNVLIILSSLADFYFPSVNAIFIKYFGHMEAKHSNLKIDGVQYIRPSGLITDTNLTAFTLVFSSLLLLLNPREFKSKYFIYFFYLAAGYSFGMLASRSALIAVIISAVLFFIFKFAKRKNVLVFLLLFFLVQLLTPQTQARFGQLFNKTYIEEEIGIGRPIIWSAAFNAFKSKPIIGIGTGVFFKESYKFLNEIISSYSQERRDQYHLIMQQPDSGGINPHNIFLVMLAEFGLTGFIFFLILIFILSREIIRRKQYISLIFFFFILFVSSLSNYAPYYKYYLMLCIIFYILSKNNMKEGDNIEPVNEEIKNILVIKICCMGDVVFITPMLSALRKKYPEAKIYLVSASWVKNIFPYLYGVDEKIIFNSPLENNFISRISGTIKLIFKIRKLNIDLGITTHRKNAFGMLLMLSGIKYRLGFTGTKYLTSTGKFDDTIHETKRYSEILRSFGIESNEPAMLIQKKDKTEIRKNIGVSKSDLLISIFPFGGVNPGTNMVIKRWEIEKYIVLISNLRQFYPDAKILVFEGTGEDEKIDKAVLPAGVILNNINDDILSVTDLFISADTGSLHIAAAFGASTHAIFGPSSPEHLAPLNYDGAGSINRYIWKKPVCSPCYTPITSVQKENPKYWQGNTFICNTGTHECIKAISAEEVFDVIGEMIKKLKLK